MDRISLGASYFDSFHSSDSRNSTQKYIRQRFLQMIVLLMSLLNDDDLQEIKNFIEDTYNLSTDRSDLEMLFLKVLPLASINPKVFLDALVYTIERHHLPSDVQPGRKTLTPEDCWKRFLVQRLHKGFLVPGSMSDLGSEYLSWLLKWPHPTGLPPGVKSSSVFNDMQFCGTKFRAINDIPPFEQHPEDSLSQVAAVLVDGSQFMIGSEDVQKITLLERGIYNVTQATENRDMYDLHVEETPINEDVLKISKIINQLIAKYNDCLAQSGQGQNLVQKWFKPTSSGTKRLPSFQCSGRMTEHLARLDRTIFASTYKSNGRKISRVRAAADAARDINEIKGYINEVESRASSVVMNKDDLKWLQNALNTIRNLLSDAEKSRQAIQKSPVSFAMRGAVPSVHDSIKACV